MSVVFDNNVLCLLLHPAADIPNDPSTGKPIDQAQDRMSFLVEQLRETDERILIPTPVLSEFLTFASADYLTVINDSAHFEVVSFDQRAAVESAVTLRRAIKAGKGKKLGLTSDWQKVKLDRQIVAIAKVNGATTIYTTDADLKAIAADSNIQVVHVADLPLPPSGTPLFDGVDMTTSPVSSEIEPPSGRSPGDGQVKASQPEPGRRAIHLGGPEPPQPGSSPPAAEPPQSKK